VQSHSDLSHRLQVEAARSKDSGRSKLTVAQSCAAFIVFASWLALFASGILVDTEPYRESISPAGASALNSTSAPQDGTTPNPQAAVGQIAKPNDALSQKPGLFKSWVIVLLSFLPINLAWVCAAASTLGAFGEHANLARTHSSRRAQPNNPYASAVLRGFFVYLFMLSGLLLLDDTPFLHPNPGQYIRLAGFLSLFSFVVSYQPRLFNVLIVWAFHRIEMKESEDDGKEKEETHTLQLTRTAIQTELTHTVHDSTQSIAAKQSKGASAGSAP